MTTREAAAGIPTHHRPGGGFRNPPGSPQQQARVMEMHSGTVMPTHENSYAPGHFRQAAIEQQYGEANAWIMPVGGVRDF